MRKRARRRLGLATLAVASLAILVTAASAAARDFDLTGLSTNTGCNAGVPVKFTVHLKHGDLKYVDDFAAAGFDYPNETPPIPVGHPTGHCGPGEEGYSHFYFPDSSSTSGFTYQIPFGKGDAEPDEFIGDYKIVHGGHILYEHYVAGFVKVKKRDDGSFNVKSHGVFTVAGSEGGLEYGGGSTGNVQWKASD